VRVLLPSPTCPSLERSFSEDRKKSTLFFRPILNIPPRSKLVSWEFPVDAENFEGGSAESGRRRSDGRWGLVGELEFDRRRGIGAEIWS
jgi:hypothetical protein